MSRCAVSPPWTLRAPLLFLGMHRFRRRRHRRLVRPLLAKQHATQRNAEVPTKPAVAVKAVVILEGEGLATTAHRRL